MKLLLSIWVVFLLLCCDQAPPASPKNPAPAAPPIDTSTAMGYYADIDQATFKSLMQREDAVLLDVRTPPEIVKGKIAGALELDYNDESFRRRVRELDTTKIYLIYCRSGNRSGKACAMMAGMGFDTLYNLERGYMEWE